jgi:hypothetical protein
MFCAQVPLASSLTFKRLPLDWTSHQEAAQGGSVGGIVSTRWNHVCVCECVCVFALECVRMCERERVCICVWGGAYLFARVYV